MQHDPGRWRALEEVAGRQRQLELFWYNDEYHAPYSHIGISVEMAETSPGR